MPEDVISINDPELLKEIVEADPEADFFEAPPPPPEGDYMVKLFLGQKGIVIRRQKRKDVDQGDARTGPLHVAVWMDVHILDPGQPWDDTTCSYFADSIISDRKKRPGQPLGTSKLHTILRAVNQPAIGAMSLPELLQHTQSVLASEPTCGARGQWVAKAGKEEDYRIVLTGMNNFPLLDPQHPEFGHDHNIIDPKTNQAVRAYFNILSFIRMG